MFLVRYSLLQPDWKAQISNAIFNSGTFKSLNKKPQKCKLITHRQLKENLILLYWGWPDALTGDEPYCGYFKYSA